MSNENKKLGRYLIYLLSGLTLLVGISLLWNIRQEYLTADGYAKIEAQASYNKDILYRRWASMHGGVYVPVTETTPANPHLSFLPERDIITQSGRKLTLVNPAYMTRQVFTIEAQQYDVKGHITSLNPIRIENKADDWETKILHRFEKGETEISSAELINGKEYLRYMKAMIVEQSCLKCHSSQGYRLGDVRGGISVSVPMEKYNQVALINIKDLVVTHLLVYFTIALVIIVMFRRFYSGYRQRFLMQQKVIESEAILQIQNKEYQVLNEEYRFQNKELIIAKDKAEQSDKLKTAFLQNMSHEIRTPLNAIVGFTDLLPRNFDNRNKLKHFSNIIIERSKDLLGIINDILDIAKIESGVVQVNMEECNLNELFVELDTFFSEYKSKLCKQHIKIKFLINNPYQYDSTIITDKVKLRQILVNLITNAFKFTEVGEIVCGCNFEKNNKLSVFVSDTGVGIPTEVQNKVFERFVQLNQNSTKNAGGTGLGLSIVAGLVNLLEGKIKLDSEPGKGSTFSIIIPYKLPVQVQTGTTNDKYPLLKNMQNKTVLIVEDDIFNSEYLKEILIDTDAKVLLAESGKEAIDISQNQSIDLILMDINLPDISGYEATRKVREKDQKTIIIAQTAYASFDEKQRAIEAGCNDFISKPMKSEELRLLIQKYLT
jgi:signal transduction histidine kinase/CheY-like chemotaxis protein